MFYIALDKTNWSQPKIEKSYIYMINIYNINIKININKTHLVNISFV